MSCRGKYRKECLGEFSNAIGHSNWLLEASLLPRLTENAKYDLQIRLNYMSNQSNVKNKVHLPKMILNKSLVIWTERL